MNRDRDHISYFRRCFYCHGVFTSSYRFRQHRDLCFEENQNVRSVFARRRLVDSSQAMGRRTRDPIHGRGRRSITMDGVRWPPLRFLANGVEAMIHLVMRRRGALPVHQIPASLHQHFDQFPEEMRVAVLRGCLGVSFDPREIEVPAPRFPRVAQENPVVEPINVVATTQTENTAGEEDMAAINMDVDRWSELLRLELNEEAE